MAVILFLIFTFGMKYLDPPEEIGIAVNFGTTDVGSGDIQPTEPIKAAPEEIPVEETEVEEVVDPLRGLVNEQPVFWPVEHCKGRRGKPPRWSARGD